MDDQGNVGGILGKFRQRLRNIRILRSKKKINNDEFIKERIDDIRVTIHKEPVNNYKNSKNKGIDNTKKEILVNDRNISDVIVDIRNTSQDRNYNKKKVGINVDNKKINVIQKDEVKNDEIKNNNVNNESDNNKLSKDINKVKVVPVRRKLHLKKGISSEKEELLKNLGIEIINKIKSSFEDKIDELDVLESELYFLGKELENELEIKKVKELKEKINKLVKHINGIIEQYNLYKKNYYIENVIGIDDNLLLDDIINYRCLLDSLDDQKKFVKDYKALEEFGKLYCSLKSVKSDAEKLILDNEEKINEFDIRDKKYNNIKLEMIPVNEINKKCSLEIDKQNKKLKDLMNKIDTIDSREYVTRHMNGIGDLISQSLRYMGLLVLSPLKGLIPSIAVETLNTRMMIKNIYNNLHMEEVKHIHYSAINYDSELNHHLCSIDYTEDLLNDTLSDIERLKEDFMLQYDSRISGYDETLKNILKIEDNIRHNQNRVNIIKNNLKRSKKINEEKMIKVRKLNNN